MDEVTPQTARSPRGRRARSRRLALLAALTSGALMAGLVAAAAAGTSEAPPRIAFVARGDGANFADALAVGSVAGQLGAPVFTTDVSSLPEATAAGLVDHAPELVVITGGPVAVSEDVRLAILDATGLPADKVVRAAGATRYDTAVAIANLFEDLGLGVAFLPVEGTATHAMSADSAAKANDADTLDGLHADAFARAPRAATRLLVCGVDQWQLHPSNVAEFWQDDSKPSGAEDRVTYDYDSDGYGVNAYQYPEDTSIRCTITLPADSTLTAVKVPARDQDGYYLTGCTARLQNFTSSGDTVTQLATSEPTPTGGSPGSFVYDLSPAVPVEVADAGVLSVDCGFPSMTGSPRDLGYRAVRATVVSREVP